MAQRISVCTLVVLLLTALPALLVAQDIKDRIAFQRDGLRSAPTNVLVMFADGSLPHELGQSKELAGDRKTPALAPDGRTITFAAKVGAQYKLFTWTLNDQNETVGEPQRLTMNDDTSDKFPAWAPDGRSVAYLATDGDGKSTLRIIGADGAGMKVLTDITYLAAPAWRPDGQALLYIDLVDGKPVLKNILSTGGLGVTIRGQSSIIAASYSPDGTNIAALIRNSDGTCDLWTIPPFGIGGKKVVSKIAGAKSVSWYQSDMLLFNAAKIGTRKGKPFWRVKIDGTDLADVTGYADPAQIANFSMQKGDLSAQLPVAVDPNTGTGPDKTPATEPVPSGPVTIVRPLASATVRGTVAINIQTQKGVSSFVLRIGDDFTYATALPQDDDTTTTTYSWNTQLLTNLDPTRSGLPARYQTMLRYPDGDYNLTVIGLDKDNKQMGVNQIKVTVQNGIPDSEMPTDLRLKYQFPEGGGDDRYQVHGEGQLFGSSTKQGGALNALLDAQIRRSIIEVKAATGNAELRTSLREPRNDLPLTYGLKQSSIPEADISALYTLTPNGDLTVIPQQREKVYLPLSEFTLPFPTDPVTIGYQWSAQMRVVTDLLARDATPVQANSTTDGLEWINNRRCIRIRSEFNLRDNLEIATSPASDAPGMRGAKAAATPAAGAGYNPGGMMGAQKPTGTPSIKATSVVGVRYTWFDFERNSILQIEDAFLYTFPDSALSGGGTGGGTPATPTNPMNPAPVGNPFAPAGPGAVNGPGVGPMGAPLGAPINPADGDTVDDTFGNPFGPIGKPATGGPKPSTKPKATINAFYLVRYTYRAQLEEATPTD